MQHFHKDLKICVTFLVLLITIIICDSSEVPRPRGVSLSRASLYTPPPPTDDGDSVFVCLDGQKTIPFTHVNDDYCDCADASDEPGTAACPHGIFHCTNAGHKPLNLASSRVNDGICDCCDGSDEYAAVGGGTKCHNNCLVLGRHAREEAQRLTELIKAGKQLRNELSQKGIQLKQEKTEKLTELQKHKEEAERVKTEKQTLKDEIEVHEKQALEFYRRLEEEERAKKLEIEQEKNRAEAIEVFVKFDSNQDGTIDITELQVRQTFDKDKNGEVSIEEAKYFLNNEESGVDLEKFISDAWPIIKPYLMMDSGVFKPPVTTGETVEDNNRRKQPSESEDEDFHQNQNDEVQEEEQRDVEGGYEEGEGGIDDDDDEEEEEENEEKQEPEEDLASGGSTLVYDDETQKLVDQATAARNEYAQAERDVRDIESEIKSINEYLEKDFGPDEEFATLEGQCYDYSDHEYIYKLCPFEKTVQQPKSGASETRLGSWGQWSGSTEGRKYDTMLYDKGQPCWNGPQRSSLISISCGTENKVISVSEPNRCEYHFEFVTPAACRELSGGGGGEGGGGDDLHDEL